MQLFVHVGPVDCQAQWCAEGLQVADVAEGEVAGPGAYVPAVRPAEVIEVGFGPALARALSRQGRVPAGASIVYSIYSTYV